MIPKNQRLSSERGAFERNSRTAAVTRITRPLKVRLIVHVYSGKLPGSVSTSKIDSTLSACSPSITPESRITVPITSGIRSPVARQ